MVVSLPESCSQLRIFNYKKLLNIRRLHFIIVTLHKQNI